MEPVFATALHIRHVRHLKDFDIPLSKDSRKNLILTGKNGSGKTSVLKALVSYLEAIISNQPDEETCRKQLSYYQQELNACDDSESGRRQKLKLERDIKTWETYLSKWTDGATMDFTSLAYLKDRYSKGEFILAHFGDNRKIEVVVPNNIEKVELKPVYTIQDAPSNDLAKYLVNLKTIQAFADTEGNHKRAEQIKQWFVRFESILKRIYDEPTLRLAFDIENFRFSICMEDRDPFDFNTMSMGYAAVFDVIADLMLRMERHQNYDLEGVVLIDEIETHLHVELQKNIIPILTELFPNLQLILTTHSPFILSSARNSVVFDLENKTLVRDGLANLPYEGIVEGYFNVDTLSQELREKFTRYQKLVAQPDVSGEACAELAELETYLDEVPDYLALDFSEAYHRLKLEYHTKK